jgi:hypothetical protein
MTPSQNFTAINSAALDNPQGILEQLFALNGRPIARLLRINPEAPRLREFRIINSATGAWIDASTSANGPDLVSFVEYATALPRPEAAELLRALVGDAVERVNPAEASRRLAAAASEHNYNRRRGG